MDKDKKKWYSAYNFFNNKKLKIILLYYIFNNKKLKNYMNKDKKKDTAHKIF